MTHDLSAPPERRDPSDDHDRTREDSHGRLAGVSDAAADGAPSTAESTESRAARAASAAGALRRLALRVHFYAGILVGPFLLVAALTGFLYALAPQAEKVVYHSWTTAQSEETRVSLPEQIDIGTREFPGLELQSVVVGAPGENTRVLFADPQLPSSSYTRVAFVDPSTGDVAATSVQYGSGQALPLRTWISEMHRRLHLGEPGRFYSELAASWLAPIALFGLYLWWDRRRRSGAPVFRLRRSERSGTRWWGGPGRAGHRDRHALVGAWIAIALLGLSATGLTWSRFAGENVTELRAAAGWETPSLGADGEHAAHNDGAAGGSAMPDMPGMEGMQGMSGMEDMHDMEAMHDMEGIPGMGDMPGMGGMHDDHAMPSARAASATVLHAALDAGLSAPVQLTPPAEDGGAWTIAETRRSYTAGPDSLSVDPATGAIVDRLDFADYPVAAKLADWGIRAHMGLLFGVVNQLLLAAVAAALVVVIARGYVMWWKRRPVAKAAPTEGPVEGLPRGIRLGKAPSDGAYLELVRSHPLRTGLATLAVVAVGYAVPLLGLSLLAFLAIDLVVQGSRRIAAARAARSAGVNRT